MASGKLVGQLINTVAEGNHDAFRQVSEEVFCEERAKHHHLLTDDLEKILYGRTESTKRKGHEDSVLEIGKAVRPRHSERVKASRILAARKARVMDR